MIKIFRSEGKRRRKGRGKGKGEQGFKRSRSECGVHDADGANVETQVIKLAANCQWASRGSVAALLPFIGSRRSPGFPAKKTL